MGITTHCQSSYGADENGKEMAAHRRKQAVLIGLKNEIDPRARVFECELIRYKVY